MCPYLFDDRQSVSQALECDAASTRPCLPDSSPNAQLHSPASHEAPSSSCHTTPLRIKTSDGGQPTATSAQQPGNVSDPPSWPRFFLRRSASLCPSLASPLLSSPAGHASSVDSMPRACLFDKYAEREPQTHRRCWPSRIRQIKMPPFGRCRNSSDTQQHSRTGGSSGSRTANRPSWIPESAFIGQPRTGRGPPGRVIPQLIQVP